MSTKRKTSTTKTRSRNSASNKELKPKYNTKQRVPADVLKSIKSRQKLSIEREKTLQGQDRSSAMTREEDGKRDLIIASILKKLDIYDEFLELEKLEKKRDIRWLKALRN